MSRPDPIIPVLAPFRPLFAAATWPKVLVLVRGTLLVRGRRTVAAALRVMGHAADPAFTGYHQVLNRAVWSPLAVSGVLLLLLVAAFLPLDAPIQVVCDEHLERRWGPRILKRGHYRDAVRSSRTRSVSSSGLSWLCVMLLVPLPWTDTVWALPFLTILLTPPALDRAAGRRHKTLTCWTQQVLLVLRHWLPERAITVLGDGHYSSLDLGHTAVAQRIQLVAPLRWDAALFAPVPPRAVGQRGAPRVKGARLPPLAALLTDPQTPWTRAELPWYAQGGQEREWVSGQALWYHGGKAPLVLRWVLTRDPRGRQPPHAYFQTELAGTVVPQLPGVSAPVAPAVNPEPAMDPGPAAPGPLAAPPGPAGPPLLGADAPAGRAILVGYQLRWRVEVTLEESRAHLGVETQRQWSAKAIARSTPALLGLFSVVVLLGHALHPDGAIPVRQAAWYPKAQATFSDVLATVRTQLWREELLAKPTQGTEQIMIQAADLARVMQAAAA